MQTYSSGKPVILTEKQLRSGREVLAVRLADTQPSYIIQAAQKDHADRQTIRLADSSKQQTGSRAGRQTAPVCIEA